MTAEINSDVTPHRFSGSSSAEVVLIKELGMNLTTDASERQRVLGQFMTAEHVATFMASLFTLNRSNIRLLDPGAGTGVLTTALIRELCSRVRKPKKIDATLYEVDPEMIPALNASITDCSKICLANGIDFVARIFNSDFITSVVPLLRKGLWELQEHAYYDLAIVNPPYRQIRADSRERHQLSTIGIETVNLYSAFVSLITRLLTKDGQLVAITPRSFANGPYFLSFRRDLLSRMAIKQLHLFDSRLAVFKTQGVLQETVIFHASKLKIEPKSVFLSASSGEPGSQISRRRVKYGEIIHPDDPDKFIHFDVGASHKLAQQALQSLPSKLADLQLSVSTGRVVDFRAKQYLGSAEEPNGFPLIYPHHFHNGFIEWPKLSRKPESILESSETDSLLVPAGNYVLVKRFSSKEERRRVVASVLDPERIQAIRFGIENHLNYFHRNGRGLPHQVAIGLAAYLNSTVVDTYFRRFSGHTQVNAADLRKLTYPSLKLLEQIGSKIGTSALSQADLDSIINQELWETN